MVALCLLGATAMLGAGSAEAASIAVTNTNNSGPGSLRSAIDQANAAADVDTINVPAGNYVLSGTGDNNNVAGDLDISHDVTINGAGAGQTTIDANNLDRVFDVSGNSTAVTFAGLRITGGNAQAGAAVESLGAALTFNGVDISRNRAGGSNVSGTAIVYLNTVADGSLTITDSTIAGNHVGGGGPAGGGTSGALYLFSTAKAAVSITNSTISGNTAGGGGGPGAAGALYLSSTGDATLDMTGAKLEGNTAGGGGATGHGDAGAVYVSASGSSVTTIGGSSFLSNRAGGDGGTGTAGAIFTYAAGPLTTKLDDTIVSGNRAGGDGALRRDRRRLRQFECGGRRRADGRQEHARRQLGRRRRPRLIGHAEVRCTTNPAPGRPLTIDRSSITNNTAGGTGGSGTGGGLYVSGGGTHNIVNSTIAGNKAGTDVNSVGGGIYNDGGTTAITNSTIQSNSAAGPAGSGGALQSNDPLTLKNTIIAANSAANGAGCGGTFSSAGHNIETADTCALNAAGDHEEHRPQARPARQLRRPDQDAQPDQGKPCDKCRRPQRLPGDRPARRHPHAARRQLRHRRLRVRRARRPDDGGGGQAEPGERRQEADLHADGNERGAVARRRDRHQDRRLDPERLDPRLDEALAGNLHQPERVRDRHACERRGRQGDGCRQDPSTRARRSTPPASAATRPIPTRPTARSPARPRCWSGSRGCA